MESWDQSFDEVAGIWWPGGGAGLVTDAVVRCPSCLKNIKVRVFSAGLSDMVVLTCDSDSTILTISIYDQTLRAVLGGYPNKAWNESQDRKVESNLKPCPCGGNFKFDILPRCPNCGKAFRVERLAESEFVVVDRLIDGEKENPWR